ncbi:MAG: DUF5602 domain-containing protein [Azoarcus sp.]|nr:DUF5602 domain-containing protein [Azoarcus sp.]MDX9839728.1 DUF5602 domain-containing protein [Azoarcus sp.]
MARLNRRFSAMAVAIAAVSALGVAPAFGQAGSYAGPAVPMGKGEAHAVVRTGADGAVTSIGVVMTVAALEGLPAAAGEHSDFPYHLPMPASGPRTVVDHVVVNWEAAGHPPSKVYDVPHFDFHFYVVNRDTVERVEFSSPDASGAPEQQPPAELMAPGYVLPPGTAKSKMGVHAVNPGGGEFQHKPFNAAFIYGYYNRQLTFIEPMVSLAYLKSKPSFSAVVPRPATYSWPGAYPSSYRVAFDDAQQTFEISLEALR